MKLMFASGWFELWIAATHTLSDKLVRKERFQKSHLFAAFAASSSAPCSRCGNWSCNSCGLDGVVWRNLPRTSSTISYSHQSLANFETKTIAFQKPAATWCLSPQCETVADQTRLSLLTFGDFFLKIYFFSWLDFLASCHTADESDRFLRVSGQNSCRGRQNISPPLSCDTTACLTFSSLWAPTLPPHGPNKEKQEFHCTYQTLGSSRIFIQRVCSSKMHKVIFQTIWNIFFIRPCTRYTWYTWVR